MDTNRINRDVIFAAETADHNPAMYRLNATRRVGNVLVCGAASEHKDQLQRSLMVQDMIHHRGLVVIDTTGRFAQHLLDHVPPWRAHDTLYFNPTDEKYAVGFNLFRGVPPQLRSKAAQDLMHLFKDIWGLSYEFHPLLLTLLRNAARLLFDDPNSTLVSLHEFLINEPYRKRLVARCTDAGTRGYWQEFETWPKKDRREKPLPVTTRLQAFMADPYLRAVVGQVQPALNLEAVISNESVLLIDLRPTELGSEAAMLLGCLFATRLRLALAANQQRASCIYIPDCQRFHPGISSRFFEPGMANVQAVVSANSLAVLPAESRNQLLEAETVLAFRLGADDTRLVASRFNLAQVEEELQTLLPHQLAATHMSYPLRTIDFELPMWQQRLAIARRSRRRLCTRRRYVEAKIDAFLAKPNAAPEQMPRQRKRRKKPTTRPPAMQVHERQEGETIFSTWHQALVKIRVVAPKTVTVELPNGQLVEHERLR